MPPNDTSAGGSVSAPDAPGYVYAATDFRPRQAREIELCRRAASFDWMYTGSMAVGLLGSEYVSIAILKQQEEPGARLLGAGFIGFFWGGLLGGGYLSLPKCDPTWAEGAPPEGDIRASWPMAAAISIIATATAPVIDYMFLGPVPIHWRVTERSGRVFVGMGAGALGSLFPYLLPPQTWAAKKEIDRIRLGEVAGGPFVSYTLAF